MPADIKWNEWFEDTFADQLEKMHQESDAFATERFDFVRKTMYGCYIQTARGQIGIPGQEMANLVATATLLTMDEEQWKKFQYTFPACCLGYLFKIRDEMFKPANHPGLNMGPPDIHRPRF